MYTGKIIKISRANHKKYTFLFEKVNLDVMWFFLWNTLYIRLL